MHEKIFYLSIVYKILAMAFVRELFCLVSAEKEATFEQLHGNYGKDELEQKVDYQNIEDIL